RDDCAARVQIFGVPGRPLILHGCIRARETLARRAVPAHGADCRRAPGLDTSQVSIPWAAAVVSGFGDTPARRGRNDDGGPAHRLAVRGGCGCTLSVLARDRPALAALDHAPAGARLARRPAP